MEIKAVGENKAGTRVCSSGWGDETTDRIIWENLTGVISEQAFEKGEGGNRKDMFKEHQEHGTQMGGKEVKR